MLQGRIGTTDCMSDTWVSDSTLICKVASGNLPNRDVTISVGTQWGSYSASFSYDGPWVTDVIGLVRPTTGAATVTLIGHYYGPTQRTARGRVGGTACENSQVLFMPVFRMLVPG